MLVGEAVWQDFVVADTLPTLAGTVTITPVTGYDGKWWRMVERQQIKNGGRGCNYIPRTPKSQAVPILSSTVIVNLVDFRGDDGEGNVRIIGKTGIIAAREWFYRGYTSRPQRGDTIESPKESFYVEEVEVVEKQAPDGVVRDLKYRLSLEGASHRRV